jgi:hypothetical protein
MDAKIRVEEEAMLHTDFLQQVVNDRQRELEERTRFAGPETAQLESPDPAESVVLRLCSVRDDADLERLAELEGKPVPVGRQIVAEVGGVVIAALPLAGGSALTDPFRRTSHLVPLLELRAKQLGTVGTRRHAWLLGAVRSWSRA